MVTLASLGGNVVTERPDGVELREWTINGSTAYMGCVVSMSGQASPDVAPVDAAGEIPYGIVVKYADETESNPDTVMTDNKRVLIAPCGSGIVARVLAVTSRGALVPGEYVMHAGDRMIESAWAAADNLTTSQQNWLEIIGRCTEYDADVAAWDYVEVRLCK